MLKEAFANHPTHFAKRVFPLLVFLFLLFTIASPTLAAPQSHTIKSTLVGPKKFYLALGDSLALGYQPNFNFDDGYADDLFLNLKGYGTSDMANLGCYGETSFTFVNFSCPVPFIRKYPYFGTQLQAALDYLHQHSGQVSPVTLDIGANDLVFDFNKETCTVSPNFLNDLHTLDTNLTQTILPQLHTALVVKGQVTGDLVMLNYYDPYQNICPNTVPYFQTLDQHLANDVSSFGIIVDVFAAFGGSKTPNNHICTYTWMCSIFNDYHATNDGYSTIADAVENSIGY